MSDRPNKTMEAAIGARHREQRQRLQNILARPDLNPALHERTKGVSDWRHQEDLSAGEGVQLAAAERNRQDLVDFIRHEIEHGPKSIAMFVEDYTTLNSKDIDDAQTLLDIFSKQDVINIPSLHNQIYLPELTNTLRMLELAFRDAQPNKGIKSFIMRSDDQLTLSEGVDKASFDLVQRSLTKICAQLEKAKNLGLSR